MYLNKALVSIAVGSLLFTMDVGIAAADPVVTAGSATFTEGLGSVRYRSFKNTGGDEIYIGIPDLGNPNVGGFPGSRAQRNITWVAGTNQVTFTYDQTNDKLTTTVVNSTGTYPLDYLNFSSQLSSRGKTYTPADLNVMQISVVQQAGSTVDLNDVYLEGSYALGSFSDSPDGWHDWTVTNACLSDGFTLTGKIVLSGPFSNSQESSKIQVSVGFDQNQPSGCNQPPVCTGAYPSITSIWPPNHNFIPVSVLGVTDPDGDEMMINIDTIYQDEPVNGLGDGDTAPDGQGIGSSTAEVRAERAGNGDGRVYHIGFTANDGNGGTCSGEVMVNVPHNKKATAVDGGALYDSTVSP